MGTVVKVSPEGEVLLEIKLKGKKPTNIAFKGSDGRTCYVTVADRGNVEWFRVESRGGAGSSSSHRREATTRTCSGTGSTATGPLF